MSYRSSTASWTLPAVLLTALASPSCSSVDCSTDNDSAAALQSVPVPANYTAGLPALVEEKEAVIRRQSYSLDYDGEFSFHRSVEAEAGTLGADYSPLDTEAAGRLALEPYTGVRVRSVDTDGPAVRGGLKPDDVITSFAGQGVASVERLEHLVERTKPGERVELAVQRGGQRQSVTVEMGSEKRIVRGRGTRVKLAVKDDWARAGLKLAELNDEVRPIVLGPAGERGLLVVDVLPGGPAFHADLKARDLVVQVGGQPVSSLAAYSQALEGVEPGTKVIFSVRRGDRPIEAPVEVERDATSEGGFNLLNLVKYKSRPQKREFSLLFDLLFNYERCYSIRREDHTVTNRRHVEWATVLHLLRYEGTRGGRKELRIGWILPLSWGG